MKTLLVILLVLPCVLALGQNTSVVTTLSSSLSETSGLITLNGKLITHNDSGGEAALYEIDTITGNFTRKVIVENANNVDWEDLARDNQYIFIGDFGNNNGNRTNLKIYRVLISDYFNAVNDTVQAEEINYSYADQTDFTYSQYSTNFDAEAMEVYHDTIYIFTKNWGNQKSYVYGIPNAVGTFAVPRIDSLNPQGLITGATYDSLSQNLILCGYEAAPFVFQSTNIQPPFFSTNVFQKIDLNVQNSVQIEGVTSIGSHYYLSAEQNPLGTASLYRLNNPSGLAIEVIDFGNVKIYPNPVIDWLTVETVADDFYIEVYNVLGNLVLRSNNKTVDVKYLPNGSYFVKFFNGEGREIGTAKIFKIEQ
ncbi:MAG: T9SS type A sorting domain-containing protein [Putridiphycobacter sp.]|nr:T9SS type A sorting domain-containing protein [Putridiphycobacter sp.]